MSQMLQTCAIDSAGPNSDPQGFGPKNLGAERTPRLERAALRDFFLDNAAPRGVYSLPVSAKP